MNSIVRPLLFLPLLTIGSHAAVTANWDFNDTLDSVSSTAGTLTGDASLSGGSLNLTGNGGFDSNTAGGLGGTGSFTVIVDFLTSNTSNNQTLFSYTPSNGSDGGADLRLFAQSNGNLRIEMSAGAGFEADLGSLDLNDGAPHRVAAIFNSSIGDSFFDVDLYVDGNLFDVTGGTDHLIDLGATVTTPNEVSFGNQLHVPGDRVFTGNINFAQIHDTALAPAEISAIPEPGAALLGGLGLLGLLRRRR